MAMAGEGLWSFLRLLKLPQPFVVNRRAIHTMLQEKDEGVILTTHHMEEAEVLCDRIAIMVSGQLRWASLNILSI